VLAATIGTGEERILAVQCDRADRAFDDVAVNVYASGEGRLALIWGSAKT
jgi:hypothetical protein